MTFISYAQNNEDVILWRALKHLETGFYVDVGANDPSFDSVTRAFYDLGWHGINIEPMESYCERLSQERPNDINLCCAVGASESDRIFYEIPNTGLSTLESEIAEQVKINGWTIIEHEIHVITLNQIFSEHITGPIHFLKIDVEGSEKDVLDGLDLTRWRPWILVIESTVPSSAQPNHQVWEDLVLGSNYLSAYYDGLNRFYIASEQAALVESFKTPPNIFDDFISASRLEAIRNLDEQKNRIAQLEMKMKESQTIYLQNTRLLEEMNAVHQAALNIVEHQKALLHEKDIADQLLQTIIEQQANLLQEKDAVNQSLHLNIELQTNLLHEKEEKLSAARVESDALSSQLYEVSYALNSVYNSKSWRVTKPLRILFLPLHSAKKNRGETLQKLKHRGVLILRSGLISIQKKPFITRIAIKLKKRYPDQWRMLTWRVKKIAFPPPPLPIQTSDSSIISEEEQYYIGLFQHESTRWQDKQE